MKLGEVFIWETDKVQKHKERIKRHIFVYRDELDRENVFLLINTSPGYRDHKLLQESYKEFLDYDSYVGGNGVFTYTDAELRIVKPAPVGQLTRDDLKNVRDAIIAADTMERARKERVCRALAAAL